MTQKRIHTARKGLTFVELAFAMGLLLFAAGGVLSIIIAGAGYPVKAQQGTQRQTLCKQLIDQQLNLGSVPANTGGFIPVPGSPDFNFKVTVTSPASWAPADPQQAMVQVDVQGPTPNVSSTTMRAGYAQIPGSVLLAQYGCLACHVVGASPVGALGPNFTSASFQANTAAENAALGTSLNVTDYLDQSVRKPQAWDVPGFPVRMTGYPSIMDMPQGDLNAIKAYLYGLP